MSNRRYSVELREHYYALCDGQPLVGFDTPEEARAHISARRIAQRLVEEKILQHTEFGVALVVIERALPMVKEEVERWMADPTPRCH